MHTMQSVYVVHRLGNFDRLLSLYSAQVAEPARTVCIACTHCSAYRVHKLAPTVIAACEALFDRKQGRGSSIAILTKMTDCTGRTGLCLSTP